MLILMLPLLCTKGAAGRREDGACARILEILLIFIGKSDVRDSAIRLTNVKR